MNIMKLDLRKYVKKEQTLEKKEGNKWQREAEKKDGNKSKKGKRELIKRHFHKRKIIITK